MLKQISLLSKEIAGRNDVRVFVSDNSESSIKSTELENQCKEIPNFFYRRNNGNIEANANFLMGFCEAKENEVLWLLADDTTVKPGAIDFLVKNLDPNIDFYGFSTSADDEQLRLPDQHGAHLDKSISWQETGINKLISKTSWGGVTCALYDMNFFRSYVSSGFKFHNSSFPHLAILLSAYQKNTVMKVRLLPLEIIHGENTEAGDYSMSVAGMPQLFSLAPDWERKEITIRWLKRYSAAFYFSKSTHPEIFSMTRQVVKNYGGMQGYFWLSIGKIEYLVRKTRIGRKVQVFIKSNKYLARLFRRSGRTLMLGD